MRLKYSTPLMMGILGTISLPQAYAETQLEEIVVTANKRTQLLTDVGKSITAISGEKLKDRQVVSLEDFAAMIPGLNYSVTSLATPVYTLRGVGFTDGSLSAYPAVTVYVDQMPLPFGPLTANANYDLERIEVLKGPQGTLFGSNSTGGAVNYIAAKPTDTLTGGFSASYGKFSNLLLDAFASGPVNDTLRWRLAMRINKSDDWQKAYTFDGKTANANTAAGRLLVDWEPTDKLSFQLNINGWTDKSDSQQPQYFALSIQNPGLAFDYQLNYPTAPTDDARAADWDEDFPLYNDNNFFQTSLKAAYQITDELTLTSLTSYIDSKRDSFAQLGGLTYAISVASSSGTYDTFFQELRIDNGGSNNLRWTLGVNYAKDDVTEDNNSFYGESTAFSSTGIKHNSSINNQDTTSYAAFGNVEYDVLDNVTLKFGARYTETDRKAHLCAYDGDDGLTAGFFDFLQGLLTGSPQPALGLNDCFSINPATGLSGALDDELKEDNFSYTAGIDLRLSENTLVYLNHSRGYKAGGFPVAAAATWVQYTPVVQESLTSYEVGIKAQVAENRVAIDASVFYYDYTDKQLRSTILDPVFGALGAIQNIPESSVKGAEIAVSAAPVSGFTPSVSVVYLDATIDKFVGINAAGTAGDFAGTQIPFTSKWSVNADLEYRWQASDNISAFLGASYRFRSAASALTGNNPTFSMPSYGVLDLRAGFETDDGLWKVMAWGKNVTNKYYITNVQLAYDAVVRFTGRPVTYGISISRQF